MLVQLGPGDNAEIQNSVRLKNNTNCLFSSSQTAMEVMGLIAIIVNCYLIGQCGQLQRLFPWLSPEMAIISIVILEAWRTLSSPAHRQEYRTKIYDQTVF